MRGLTDFAIRNLKPAVQFDREIPDPGQRGLYVVIQPTGAKSFAVRYRYGGKPRKLTLNGGISLAAARKAAGDALYEVEQGRDPSEAKKITKAKAARAQADTVQAICEEYLAREGQKLRTASSREATLRRLVFPEIGNQPIHTLRRSQLVRLLDKIEDQNGERSADIVLAYLSRVFNWHAGRSDEFRTPIVRGMRRRNTKEHARNRILTDEELRCVWQTADAGPFGCFVRFLLLTGARRGEAAAISRKEINGGEWTLPAARNKTKVDLVRPLSAAAQQELSRVPKLAGTDFVFSIDGHSALGGFTRRKKSSIKPPALPAGRCMISEGLHAALWRAPAYKANMLKGALATSSAASKAPIIGTTMSTKCASPMRTGDVDRADRQSTGQRRRDGAVLTRAPREQQEALSEFSRKRVKWFWVCRRVIAKNISHSLAGC